MEETRAKTKQQYEEIQSTFKNMDDDIDVLSKEILKREDEIRESDMYFRDFCAKRDKNSSNKLLHDYPAEHEEPVAAISEQQPIRLPTAQDLLPVKSLIPNRRSLIPSRKELIAQRAKAPKPTEGISDVRRRDAPVLENRRRERNDRHRHEKCSDKNGRQPNDFQHSFLHDDRDRRDYSLSRTRTPERAIHECKIRRIKIQLVEITGI